MERPTTVYLNDQEWLTVQTTPVDLHDWALGYLFGEGVIRSRTDIKRLVVEEDRGLVWVDLHGEPQEPDNNFGPAHHQLTVSAPDLHTWMHEMLANAVLYQETGGIHVAMAVRTDTGERIIREDIGRHNAVDKVIGAALLAGWPARQVVILTSGRISFEMATRLARFGAGVGVSRTAATDQAYALAMHVGIELVGYVRTLQSLTIYTEGSRITWPRPLALGI